ncbi:hypothetical protein ACFQUX_29525 [Pantoea stewartii]
MEENHLNNGEVYYTKLGFTNNFSNTGEPGILIHGLPEGKVMLYDSLERSTDLISRRALKLRPYPIKLTINEFVSFVKERHSINLSTIGGDTPYIL